MVFDISVFKQGMKNSSWTLKEKIMAEAIIALDKRLNEVEVKNVLHVEHRSPIHTAINEE